MQGFVRVLLLLWLGFVSFLFLDDFIVKCWLWLCVTVLFLCFIVLGVCVCFCYCFVLVLYLYCLLDEFIVKCSAWVVFSRVCLVILMRLPGAMCDNDP